MRIAPADLRALIESDATLVQLADVGDDAGIASALNEQTTQRDATQ